MVLLAHLRGLSPRLEALDAFASEARGNGRAASLRTDIEQ